MKIPVLCAALVALAVGCSKQQDPAVPQVEVTNSAPAEEQAAVDPAANPAPEAAPAPMPEVLPDNAQIAQDLGSVGTSLQSQEYDAAVDNLAVIRQVPMNDAQRQAYQDQLYQTMEYLRQRAENDARARAAYQRLGRSVTGR